jgi:large subunit ribosomal protein L4
MPFDISVLNDALETVNTVSGFPTLEDYSVKTHLLSEVVRAELSNLRTGNAHTKTRGEVRGGGKKPWKQKGTGRARHGSRRSPIWVGGGITFGPRNTVNWHLKINKSAKISALKSILRDRLDHKVIYEMGETFDFTKTNSFSKSVDKFALDQAIKTKNVSIVYSIDDKEMLNGVPNTDVSLINVNNLKIHKLVNSNRIILTQKAKEVLTARVS